MFPAEGGPEILKLKSSWHRSKFFFLAVSRSHWKGRKGGAGPGGGLAQGLGIGLFAFGGAYWPLATAHSDPLWVRTCFGRVSGAPG